MLSSGCVNEFKDKTGFGVFCQFLKRKRYEFAGVEKAVAGA